MSLKLQTVLMAQQSQVDYLLPCMNSGLSVVQLVDRAGWSWEVQQMCFVMATMLQLYGLINCSETKEV